MKHIELVACSSPYPFYEVNAPLPLYFNDETMTSVYLVRSKFSYCSDFIYSICGLKRCLRF